MIRQVDTSALLNVREQIAEVGQALNRRDGFKAQLIQMGYRDLIRL